ncbi:MAG: hypothetical protein H0T79_01485 [Deltaproteobacteria bacterium]|nr:hypothetical protein [Deltaproteobacteria bacterium]
MVVFSNRRLGPSAELLLAADTATIILRAIATAAAPWAEARWERELVRWLEDRARAGTPLDIADIAWTPDHFEPQRAFMLGAIDRAIEHCEHSRPLHHLRQMVVAHPRDSVQVGRLWQWR